MQKPMTQHQKLAALAGSWSGEEEITPSPWDPDGGKASATLESHLDLDGFFLITDYTVQRGPRSFRGHAVHGWDEGEKCYTMYWFDALSPGLITAARGQWVGDTLTFEQKSPTGRARYIYLFEGDGRYSFRIEHARDGNLFTPSMEGRYTRKK